MIACFAAETGRDLYQERTTVKNVASNAAAAYGAFKGLQWTGRGVVWTGKGIKKVYNYAQSKLRRSAPEIHVSFGENSLVGKASNAMTPETDTILNRLYQRESAKKRIPFVEDPIAGKWSDATISGDLVLGSDAFNIAYEQSTRYACKIDPAAPFNVVAHGNSAIMALDIQNIHPKALSQANLKLLKEEGEVLLNAVQLARVIRTAPGYKKGQHIHLFSCETGARADGIAQKLATRMGVEVSAFTENIHVFNDKPLFAAYCKATEKVGAVKTFYPQSGVSKAAASSLLLAGCDSGIEKSVNTYDDLMKSYKEEQQQRSLFDRIVSPEMSPFIKESSEIIRTACQGAINRTNHSMIPNPLDLSVAAALAYGGTKGILGAGKGIQNLYQKSKNLVKNITDGALNRVHQWRYAAEGKVPFVHNPRAGKWDSSECNVSGTFVSQKFASYDIAKMKRDSAAPFTVIAEGGPNFIWIKWPKAKKLHPKALSEQNLKILKKKGEITLDVPQAAQFIRTHPEYHGQHINILACNAGRNPKGFAQKLAVEMNVPVSAFTGSIVPKKDGSRFSTIAFGKKLGVMKTFYPNEVFPTRLLSAAAISVLMLAGDEPIDVRVSDVNPVETYDDLLEDYRVTTYGQSMKEHRSLVDRIVNPEMHPVIKESSEIIHAAISKLFNILTNATADTRRRIPFVEDGKQGTWNNACISTDLILSNKKAQETESYLRVKKNWNIDQRCPFNVVGHGDPFHVQIDTKDIHPGGLDGLGAIKEAQLRIGGTTKLNAKELKQLIETAPGYKPGQPVNLYSCQCGAHSEGIAQELADEMEVPVSACTGNMVTYHYPGTDKAFFTAGDVETGFKEIKTFYPRDPEEPKQRRISNID